MMGFLCGDNCKMLHTNLRSTWLRFRDDYEKDQLLENGYTNVLGYCPTSIIPGNTSSTYFLLNKIMDSVVEKVTPSDWDDISIGGKFSIIKYSAQISLSSNSTRSSVVDKCSTQAWLESVAKMEKECEGEDCLNSKITSGLGNSISKLGPYILPCISLLTCICLVTALAIFARFRCLWCDRIVLHCQLFLALLLRMITSTIRHYFSFYKKVEWICKALVTLDLYAQCAVVAWTFVQGIFLHNKVTRVMRIFRENVQQKLYFLIGWGFPLALITAFELTIQIKGWATTCGSEYEETGTGMRILAYIFHILLVVNMGMIINIVRILVTKGNRSPSISEAVQFRRSVQATFILTFLQCVYYLPALFSVDGDRRKWLKSICISCQGIYIAIMLCFFNKDVRKAIHGWMKRFWESQIAYEDHLNERAQVPRLTHRQMTLPPFFSRELPTTSGNKRYSTESTAIIGDNDDGANSSDEENTLTG